MEVQDLVSGLFPWARFTKEKQTTPLDVVRAKY
jgi:hypothetical protein